MSRTKLLEFYEGFYSSKKDNPMLEKGVTLIEAEEIFTNKPLLISDGTSSFGKKTFICLGKTESGRYLCVEIEPKDNKIKILNARNMNKKEEYAYADYKAVTFPNLQLSNRTISLRLPEALLNDLKLAANKMDVPYQSLIKILLSEGVKKKKMKS